MYKRNLTQFLMVAAAAVVLLPAGAINGVKAQPRPQAQSQPPETDDEVKVNLYTRFTQTYKTNKPAAYETAKAYLQRYAKDNDQYAKYIQLWVTLYEKELRMRKLRDLVYNDRNFAEAFRLGKQVIADDPDQLDSLIALGNAGYLAFRANDENYSAEGLKYASHAIQLIDSGKAPDDWTPFKGKDETLAFLYSAMGLLKLKATPIEAVAPLIKSTQWDTDLKRDPFTYFYIARAYETGLYAKLSADYQKNFADKEETPASKQALEKLNQVIDRIIDAYARAVAQAGSKTENAANRKAWLDRLTVLYKFRHGDSDAGLNELIASVLSKPIPPAL